MRDESLGFPSRALPMAFKYASAVLDQANATFGYLKGFAYRCATIAITGWELVNRKGVVGETIHIPDSDASIRRRQQSDLGSTFAADFAFVQTLTRLAFSHPAAEPTTCAGHADISGRQGRTSDSSALLRSASLESSAKIRCADALLRQVRRRSPTRTTEMAVPNTNSVGPAHRRW